MTNFLYPLLGGALIGGAASLMLFLNGRVTGVSSILNRAAVVRIKGDIAWRWFFIFGLFLGGFAVRLVNGDAPEGHLPTENWTVAIAGILVGYGTVLGSGCTSGHGVCGISRLSPRSVAATVTFILAGVLAVFVFRKLGLYQ